MRRLVRENGEKRLQCCDVRVFVPHGRAEMVRHLRLAHRLPAVLARQYVAAVLQPRKRRTWWGEQGELFAPGQCEAPACAAGAAAVREPPASAADGGGQGA